MCNVITPYMPITTDGKAPDLGRMKSLLKDTISKAVRGLNRYESKNGIDVPDRQSQKNAILSHLDDAMNQASGGGQYRYSIRQLYYAVRPYILSESGKELDYNNFVGVITNYEAEMGQDLPGVYRDPRGTLYHPHIHESISLGTLNVEKYQQPEWTFNKVLYIEKEGFFEILKEAKWPERHDCALVTSKGFASRAARDVIDLLGDSGEGLLFFCIHDADASGTLIYQSLMEATKARPERRVEILNLGLEPEEGRRMGLQVEKPEETKRAKPVAEYVSEEDKEWLQDSRIELNAMDTPRFISWLDEKMEQFGQGKLIPPIEILTKELREGTELVVRETITAAILEEAGIDEKVDNRMKELEPVLEKHGKDLEKTIEKCLLSEPTRIWREPVKFLAERILLSNDSEETITGADSCSQ